MYVYLISVLELRLFLPHPRVIIGGINSWGVFFLRASSSLPVKDQGSSEVLQQHVTVLIIWHFDKIR